MFKKLVSNLPFSPSLVKQLGFYAQRLKKEQWMRRLGLVFTVFALVIQSLAVFNPPDSANASTSNDMCPGVTRNAAGANKLRECYNNNTRNFRDVMNFFGITESAFNQALSGQISFFKTTDYRSWYTFGHNKRWSDDRDYTGQLGSSLYARHWGHAGNIDNGQYGWKGTSNGTEFIIIVNCGNLALPRLLNPSVQCVSLSASKNDLFVGDSIRLTARGAVSDGAQISDYNFSQTGPNGDNASTSVKTDSTTATWDRTLGQTGTYRFNVSINTTNNADNVTGNNCNATVTVKVVPSASCKLLTMKQLSRTKFELTSTATANDGATITGYTYTVKDSAGKVIQESKNSKNATWTVEVPENTSLKDAVTYKATLVVHTSVGDKSSTDCEKELTVPPKDVCEYNPNLPVDDEGCKPTCEESSNNPEIDCNPSVVLKKTAVNRSQGGKDAASTKANGGDVIIYTVTAKNEGKVDGKVDISDTLTDVLEYATLTDNGGGTFDSATNTLSWNDVVVPAQSEVTRTFAITVNNPIPAMAQNRGTSESYDCVMGNVVSQTGSNQAGQIVNVPVNCPGVKTVEQVVTQLPATGAGENLIFGGIIAAIVVFFYARSRQLGKEVRLVRREYNAGTL